MTWQAWVEKTVHEEETHWLTGKEKKFLIQQSVKKFMLTWKNQSQLISLEKVQQYTVFPIADFVGKIHIIFDQLTGAVCYIIAEGFFFIL